MARVTDKQRAILKVLQQYPLSISHVAIMCKSTVSAIQNSMRRMEDNGWVRRIPTHKSANKWELTQKGHELVG